MIVKKVAIGLVALIMAPCLLPACNRGGASTVQAQQSSTELTAASTAGHASLAESPNRCAMLTDAEVQEAIGPHAAGTTPGNLWGAQSCRWLSSSAQKEEADTGFIMASDWIEVGVFDPGGFGENAAWARHEAEGEPVPGFVEGARYDMSGGVLWFECAHGRFCAVKAHTRSGKHREQTVLHLAELVEKRLH